MGSDRAHVTFDPRQQYRGVVMQQGRVTLEADWNEQQQITSEEQRAEALDIIGPCGTPDNGYALSAGTPPASPYDFQVGPGTLYVGGMRVSLSAPPAPIWYSKQPDWLDGTGSPADPYWVDPGKPTPSNAPQEFVCLMLREQEVSAVEDTALREVALGGPDTAQRLRLLQRVVRFGTDKQDCAGGLASAQAQWTQDGLTFDPKTMRLTSSAKLQASYQPPTNPPDLCEPDAQGGYLGADNQLIRVQISGPNKILWGFDDASFLYRVDVLDAQALHLQSRPVDAFHQPRAQQAVEVLRSAAQLSDGGYIAATTGTVATLAAAYDPDTQQIVLPTGLPASYQTGQNLPPVFLRVWEQELSFTPGTAITLGNIGLQVTLGPTTVTNFHVGDYWLIAVRPSTPTAVYPERFLDGAQPPDGPRMWACPLAVINWSNGTFTLVADCRNQFCSLVEACQQRDGGCCTITVRPEDLSGNTTLQSIIDGLPSGAEATVCLMPGTYALPAPLLIGPNRSSLTIEGCQSENGAVIQAATNPNGGFADGSFIDGLVVVNGATDVTLRNLYFELPTVQSTSAMWAGLDAEFFGGAVSAVTNDLVVSIGVRPIACTQLTIKDCWFDFLLPGDQNVFAVGIFAGGTCQGLTIQGNKFLNTGGQAGFSSSGPFRMLVGFMLAPSAIVNAGFFGDSDVQVNPSVSYVISALDMATFDGNTFGGLAAAILIQGNAGKARIENNVVRGCYAGFWLVSLRSLAYLDLLARVLQSLINMLPQGLTFNNVPVSPSDIAHLLGLTFLGMFLDPLVTVGFVLARCYPLPQGFDSSSVPSVGVGSGATSPKLGGPLETLAANIASVYTGQDPQALQQAIESLLTNLVNSKSPLAQYVLLLTQLSGFEQAILQNAGPPSWSLSLRLSDNDLAAGPINLAAMGFTQTALASDMRYVDMSQYAMDYATVSMDTSSLSIQSSIGVLVWDDERVTGSALVMSGNMVSTQSTDVPFAAVPSALVLMAQRCTITGNQILNEASPPKTPDGVLAKLLGSSSSALTVEEIVGFGSLYLFPSPTQRPPTPGDTLMALLTGDLASGVGFTNVLPHLGAAFQAYNTFVGSGQTAGTALTAPQDVAAVAVTGNVFRGTAVLPPRTLPIPLSLLAHELSAVTGGTTALSLLLALYNSWYFLNTEL